MSTDFGNVEQAALAGQLAIRAKASFKARFWNPDRRCLFDVIEGEHCDGSIRPNQIFAVSLHHALMDGPEAKSIVDIVARDLLTPLGLRTLSPFDPGYLGRYQGSVRDRDSAYHQGTVWPWLMGPFLTAYVRVHDGSIEAREVARRWLEGVGQVCEVADGDAPHLAGGCIAQAWSV
ncbi:MAG: amylo-alpha-1,6-glucosidase, partial [Bryobacteraceae bacterium]